ncbi:MAG: PEP-CTERM sorting domain-containing protein [Planctomycetaceae bacterium]|nr:PEP-CTERM sorting domain-containing protein [Planctomycetaceae bacterium]
MRSSRWGFTAFAVLCLTTILSSKPAHAAIIDDVNGGFLPGNFIFATGINNIGWEYTPTFDYTLQGIESTFRAIANPPVATRSVTLSIYDSVADAQAGSAPLRTGTFTAGAGGGNLGISFADLLLTAGHSYFVAFSGIPGVEGLGLNIVDFDVSLPPPQPPVPPFDLNPAVDFLNGWYTGTDFTSFIDGVDSPGFAAPILRFDGFVQAVPEPGTFVLTAGLAGLGLVLRRRRKETDAEAA